MKSTWIIIAVALGVGAAGGYFLGGTVEGESTDPLAGGEREQPDRPRTESSDPRPTRPGNAHRTSGQNERLEHLRTEAGKLSSLSPDERRLAMIELVAVWARKDPAEAIRLFTQNHEAMEEMIDLPYGDGIIIGSIFREWAKIDPKKAMQWVDANKSNMSWQDAAVAAVIDVVATKDLPFALEMYETMDSDLKEIVVDHIAAEYGKLDFAATKAWIGQMNEYYREGALAGAIRGFATKFPEQAVQEIAVMPESSIRDHLLNDAVKIIARDDPAAATSLIEIASNPSFKDNVAMALMKEWAAQDSAAALAYAESLPSGASYDRAMAAFIRNNTAGNPTEMLRLAETIEYDDARDLAVMAAASRWLEADPAAARAYIRNADTISEGTREKILNSQTLK